MKPYQELSHAEKYDLWITYKNACTLCVTYAGRTDKKLSAKRNKIADDLYFSTIRYFKAEDICEPKQDVEVSA